MYNILGVYTPCRVSLSVLGGTSRIYMYISKCLDGIQRDTSSGGLCPGEY